MREMHRPTTGAQQQEARRRLAFEELFLLQMTLLLKRALARWEPRPPLQLLIQAALHHVPPAFCLLSAYEPGVTSDVTGVA